LEHFRQRVGRVRFIGWCVFAQRPLAAQGTQDAQQGLLKLFAEQTFKVFQELFDGGHSFEFRIQETVMELVVFVEYDE